MAVSLSSLTSFSSKLPSFSHESNSHVSPLSHNSMLCIKSPMSRSCLRLFANAADNDRFDSSVQSDGSELELTGDSKLEASSSSPNPKRSPLTARERLRAARVLSRYADTKSSSQKSELGSNVLDAIKESERGKKRSRLPEAPTNLFDDSKRGLPKDGFTFEFPGGFDLFVVALSFVVISTIMFATTYFVWKVGAIHFNEY